MSSGGSASNIAVILMYVILAVFHHWPSLALPSKPVWSRHSDDPTTYLLSL